MELYAQVRSERTGRPFALGEDQAVMRSTYVAASMEQARREAEEAIMSAFIFNDPFRGRQVFTNPGEILDPDVKLDWDFLEPRTLLVGSPENVVEKIQELQEICNLDYLLVESCTHGPAVEQVAAEPGDLCHQGDAAIHRGWRESGRRRPKRLSAPRRGTQTGRGTRPATIGGGVGRRSRPAPAVHSPQRARSSEVRAGGS